MIRYMLPYLTLIKKRAMSRHVCTVHYILFYLFTSHLKMICLYYYLINVIFLFGEYAPVQVHCKRKKTRFVRHDKTKSSQVEFT